MLGAHSAYLQLFKISLNRIRHIMFTYPNRCRKIDSRYDFYISKSALLFNSLVEFFSFHLFDGDAAKCISLLHSYQTSNPSQIKAAILPCVSASVRSRWPALAPVHKRSRRACACCFVSPRLVNNCKGKEKKLK